jgi:hypothetical protein
VSEFKDSLTSWTATLLGSYTAQLEAAPSHSKEFNDPVWGTILLEPSELVILDSPLLQRLRTVSQLGVVHFVYPAATHSRFEHTLGVVYQVSRLIDSINANFPGNGEPVAQRQRSLLRLTALCHDVGHGALSHVSENALKAFDQITDIKLDFADEAELEDVPLAEIASYYIIGSPAFAELLDRMQDLEPESGLPVREETIRLMQRAVIGEGIDNRIPLLHELISGPFDADKLDYMTRDAHMAGVPVVTDIPRLVQKVRAVEVAPHDLRKEIAETVKGGEASYVVTGIAFSGGRTVDELIFGRTLHEDKLYRHHKVRAIEAMIASLYQQLGAIAPASVPMLPYELRDADFTTMTQARIEEVIGRQLVDEDHQPAAVATDLAGRLARRELFVRAYAFSLGMPLDPYRADAEHFTGLERLGRESVNDFEQRGRLIDSIVVEMRTALGCDAPQLLERYPDLKPYVWLDPQYADSKPNDSARAYLISEEHGPKKVIRFQDDYAETVRWASAYIQTRDAGYIFTPQDLAEYAYVAAEKVLRRDYGIRTPETMQVYAKRPPGPLAALKERLDAAGFYQRIAYDVRPLPDRLTKADVPGRVAAFCSRMGGYEGPVRAGAAEKKLTLLSPERVLAWLHQFPGDFGDQPLQLLEEMVLIGREEVVDALAHFLAADTSGAFADGSICPLGEPKDSSAVTTYWSADDLKPDGPSPLSVGEALARPEAPLIFVEDFIGSGQQSVSILEAWLGVTPTTELREERPPLAPEAAHELRSRKLAFIFAAGQEEGAERLRARSAELGLDAVVHIDGDPVPRAFGPGHEDRGELEGFCQSVGEAVLSDEDRHHDEDWMAERALGYGNESFLALFGYNTPAQTLTCIWKEGEFEGVPWMPLFPRRAKR